MKLAPLLLLVVLVAQAPTVAPSPEPLSQVEKLRVENLKLEKALVQRAVSDWQTKALALKADMEKSRPGFSWNPDDDTWAPLPKEKK